MRCSRPPEWEKWQLCIVISIRPHGGVKPRQFSSDVLYATEQEADRHGIELGQCIIDGKVEGLSVAYMKMENRRATPRFHGQFQTRVSDATKTEALGVMIDLSAGGCQIHSPRPFVPGGLVKVGISVPCFESPIQIDRARVQWVNGLNLGLAFVRVNRREQQGSTESLRISEYVGRRMLTERASRPLVRSHSELCTTRDPHTEWPPLVKRAILEPRNPASGDDCGVVRYCP
jgi:hypothetical protein